MARSRLELDSKLRDLLTSIDNSYTKNLYYRKPSKTLNYPCIIYKRVSELTKHADNKKYVSQNRYTLTVVDRNPDSILSEKVSNLPLCSFDREYEADNLNHFVYDLYY